MLPRELPKAWLGKTMNEKFISSEANEQSEDDIADVIEQPGGYDEAVLQQELGDGSIEDMYKESYGKRGRGWKLAAGAIIITVAGLEYFRQRHGEDK